MLERLKRALSRYMVDKFEETDRKQLDQLPESIRNILIHGTTEDCTRALSDLRARERLQRKTLLAEAAMELLGDMCSLVQGE